MTTPRRFEQDLPALLSDLYLAGMPDYRDDLVQQVARTPQRPAWTFSGRWLPMELVTTRVPTTRLPMRQLGVLALIAILLATALAAYIGSQQQRSPEPFGRAGNGLVAYARGGDIFTVDASTNVSTPIVSGPEIDSTPAWSRDGRRLAFVRLTGDGESVYVADTDGQRITALTDPKVDVADLAFSPDGRALLFTAGPEGERELWVAGTEGGSEPRLIDVGMRVVSPSYRPTDGREIVFAGTALAEQSTRDAPFAEPASAGLYAIDLASQITRTILAPEPGVGRDWVRASPDGSRIAYSEETQDVNRNTYRVHVIDADGTGDLTLPMPDGAIFQDAPVWSNDGRSLAIARGYGNRNEDMVLAVVPADGSGLGAESEHRVTGCCDTNYEWAPDDTVILVKPIDLNGLRRPQLLWDPVTGFTRPAPWGADSDPAWQRIAD